MQKPNSLSFLTALNCPKLYSATLKPQVQKPTTQSPQALNVLGHVNFEELCLRVHRAIEGTMDPSRLDCSATPLAKNSKTSIESPAEQEGRHKCDITAQITAKLPKPKPCRRPRSTVSMLPSRWRAPARNMPRKKEYRAGWIIWGPRISRIGFWGILY